MGDTQNKDGPIKARNVDKSQRKCDKTINNTMDKKRTEQEMTIQYINNSDSEENNNLENILSEFKLYGRFHVQFIVLIGILSVTSAMYCTNYIFVVEDVAYRCKDSNCENNGHLSAQLNSTLDLKCNVYDLLDNSTQCTDDNINLSNVGKCHAWEYEKKDSFIAEFNLGCQYWKRTLIGTLHSVGYMFGLLLTGPLSDKFGRKTMAIFNGLAGAVIGISKSFVTWYWLYAVLELTEPLIGDSYSATYMLSVESVSKNNRPIIIVILGVWSTIGSSTQPIIAWLAPNWRIFLISIYGPSLILIFYILWLPESPRWLLNKGKTDKAAETLRNAAIVNKIKLDEKLLENLKAKDNEVTDLKTLLKATFQSREIFLRLLRCVCLWFVMLFNCYTLSINAVSLQGNKYLNFGIVSASDLPATAILLYAVTKCNRKLPIILSLVSTAFFCGTQPFVPEAYPWLSLCLYACGRMSTSVGLRILYLYTSELFPTYTRNTMHALCSSMGRFGMIIAPQTPLLLKYWAGFPSFIVGVLSLLTISVVVFMPETSGDVLPDTVCEAEAMGSKEKLEKKDIKINTITSRL